MFPKIKHYTMQENFSPIEDKDCIPTTARIHVQQPVGQELKFLREGTLYVKKDSPAAQSMRQLHNGCAVIDCVLSNKNTVLCFRDKKVQMSTYIVVSNFDGLYVK